jgi:hypothetical protein
MSPYEAWYSKRSLYKDMHIWGYGVLVPAHGTRKSENSCTLLFWFDTTTNNIKHTHGERFLELYPVGTTPTPGQRLLQLESTYKEGDIKLPLITIDVGDCAHLKTEPFAIHLSFPQTDVQLNLHLTFV